MQLTPRRGSVQAGSTRLSYLEWGREGPHAVLLHGITSNAQAWWRLAPRLVELGFHVVAFDMPGHGYSAEVADHRIEDQAALMALAAGELKMDRLLLLGHSWGGSVALALAAQAPERIDRVVLIDPALTGSAEGGRTRAPNFIKGLGSPAADCAPGIASANPDWHAEDVRWKAEAMQQCRTEAVLGFFTKSGDWDLVPAFGKIKAPLLLLVADPSATVINPQTLEAAQRHLGQNARMVVIPKTSHNMYRGAGYEPTLSALTDWLGSR